MKLLMTRSLGDKMKDIEELGYEILYVKEDELEQKGIDGFLEKYDSNLLPEIDVMFCYDVFSHIDVDDMTNLKYINLSSAGINQLPLEKIRDKNIYLSNNKLGYALPMAETVVMYILQGLKNSYKMFKKQMDKNWDMDMTWLQLAGKTVGFLGTGNIAKESARRLRAFDVNIIGLNTDGRNIEYFDRCFCVDDREEFLKECDIVVGIMPSTKETYHLMSYREFESMKDGSMFINIGRGSLVDENALEKNIHKFRCVVLDVVENEPLSKDSKLWEYENIIITPHNSWVSESNRERLGEYLYHNLKHYMEKGIPKEFIKDYTKGY